MGKKKVTSLYLDEGLMFRLEQAAKKDHRSVSTLVSLILEQHFPKPKKRLKLRESK